MQSIIHNPKFKIKLRTSLFLVWCLLGVVAAPGQSPADDGERWVKKKEGGGIAVFERTASRGAFKELKAQMTLPPTALRRLATQLLDVEGYKDWVDRTREAHVIERVNDTLQYYYAVIELPALKDRDLVARLTIHQDRATRVVTAVAAGAPGKYPPDRRFERIPDFTNTWTFVPLRGGNVRVEYRGTVPDDWTYALAKTFVWSGLQRTLANLREQVRQKPTRSLPVAFIAEPE
ncbi:MAG TPA: hypothetical protein VF646_15670 [Cytophagales bacterium]